MVKEAASLKKYNLFTDSRDLVSQSSRSSLSSPSVSTPNSPAISLTSPTKTSPEPHPPSPLAVNGLFSTPQQEKVNGVLQSEADVTVSETPQGTAEQKEAAQSVAVSPEGEAPKAEVVVQTVKAEAGSPVETPAADTTNQNETQEVVAAPQTVIHEEVLSVKTEQVELAAEPQVQSTDAAKEAEILPDVEGLKTDVEAAAQIDAPVPSPDSTKNTSAEGTDSQTVASSEEKAHCESSDVKLEAPSSVQTPALTPADLKQEEAAEPVPASDPSSLDVSGGSELAPSESTEVQVTQSSEDEGSTTSDLLEVEANLSKSPVSSDDSAEERTTSDEPAAQAEAVSDDIEAGASVEPSVEAAEAPTSQSTKEETLSDPDAQAVDSIKEIRDLVVEVIEVEELVQRYPSGVPKEE